MNEMKTVTIEHKADKVPLYSATLPEGWTIARLNKGLRTHLRARSQKESDPKDLEKISSTSLTVGEIFG
jgi:hypothetical protein